MKKSALLLVAAFALAAFSGFSFRREAAVKPAPSEYLGEYLYTVPVKKEQGALLAQQEWWHEYLEFPVNKAFLQPLFEQIKAGKVKVFKPEYPFTSALTDGQVKNILLPVDSFAVEDPENPSGYYYRKYVNAVRPEQIVSVTFYEDWYYDHAKLQLVKTVKGILLHYFPDERTTYQPAVALFYVPFPGVVDLAATTVQGISYDMNLDLVPFDHNIYDAVTTFSNADAVTREKKGVQTIVSSLVAAAGNKKTVVCDTLYPYTKALDKTQLAARMPLIAKADNIRFVEDWAVNINAMAFVKVVRGICLTQLSITSDTDGENTYRYRHIKRCAFFPAYKDATSDLLKPSPLAVDSFYSQQLFGGARTWTASTPLKHADTLLLSKTASAIAHRVKEGKLPAYAWNNDNGFDDPWSGARVKLNAQDRENIFTRRDSVMVERNGSFVTTVMETPFNYSTLNGFGFFESWSYDAGANTFRKNVKAMSLLQYKFDSGGDIKGTGVLFNVDVAPLDDPAAVMRPEYLVSPGILSTSRINGYEDRGYEDYGGDVGAQLTEYSGDFVESVYPSVRYRFLTEIFGMIKAGTLQAYQPGTTTVMDTLELQKRLVALMGENMPHADISMLYSVINELTFEEDWYYNPETNQFYKKVKAITFVSREDVLDDNYQRVPNRRELFTIRLN